MEYQEVLDFWFGGKLTDHKKEVSQATSRRWFGKKNQFDQEIRDRFKDVLDSDLNDWKGTPYGELARIIVLDQMRRNAYRNSPEMYSRDEEALQISMCLIDSEEDLMFHPHEQAFVYMTFMHSEDLHMQNLGIEKFRQLNESVEHVPRLKLKFKGNLKYSIIHRDVIEKFGRFPHRNDILGRETTEEERQHLKKYGGF
eukprot:Filipodium_phascolosomae@DN965_c0_g1_i1.p1